MQFEEYNGWPNFPTWDVFTVMTSHCRSTDGRTRAGLFVGVLCDPFRAQISSRLLVDVGHFSCLFWLLHLLLHWERMLRNDT